MGEEFGGGRGSDYEVRGVRSEQEMRFERGRAASYRRLRFREEHQITILTVGFSLLVFMLPVIFPYANNLTPIVLLLTGMILLAGCFFQSQRRFPVNITTWIGGLAMLVIGIWELQAQRTPFDSLLPVMIFAGVLVGTFLTGQF